MTMDKETIAKTDPETAADLTAHYQRIADELADALERDYPIGLLAYVWDVLETALDRSDVSFNHAGYTKAVIPYLLALNPEYAETVMCLTQALVNMQIARHG